MNIDKAQFPLTTDGYDYRVIATDLPGNLPVAILVGGDIFRLTADLKCPGNEGYSLAAARRESVRYFNVYRAADGTFCLGKVGFSTNENRTATQDSQRAIAGLRLTYNETAGEFSAEKV